jgi:hypothetical protein
VVSGGRSTRSPPIFFASRRDSGGFPPHEELRPFHGFGLATMQNPRYIPEVVSLNRRQNRNYVNNFIFMPRERAESTCRGIKTILMVDAKA